MSKENTENFEFYNILLSPSSELFKPALVVMMSAILNSGKPCHFYIMQSDWTEEYKKEARNFIDLYPQNEITIIDIDDKMFSELPPWKKRYGTYYKIIAHILLPETVERVLYLDCDLLVRKNIDAFYSMDFEDKFSISEIGKTRLFYWNNCFESKNYMTSSGGLSNLGVILLNLRKLREENLTIDYYIKISKEFNGDHFAESGLLSYIFCMVYKDGMKLLPAYKYNYVLCRAGDKTSKENYSYIFSLSDEEKKQIAVPPYWNEEYNEEEAKTIVHFCGPYLCKPWITIPKITNNQIESIETWPSFHRDFTIENFYVEWWEIAAKLPEKYFYQMLFEAEHSARMRARDSIRGVNNIVNFLQEFILDNYGNKKFARYIHNLKNKNIAILMQNSTAAKIFKKAIEYYKFDIYFSSDKVTLNNLTPEEFAECQKADVVISCCVHGTKTHERDGVKCIDIWDILRDDSLTANLPEISDGTDNIKIDGSISELHEDILKLSEHINEEFVKLSKISDEALKEEIKTLHFEKDKLNEELGRLSSENKSLTERIAQITEEKSTLLENILSVSREKESLNSELFELNSKLNAEQNAASAAIRKADSLSADISLLKEKIAQLEKGKSIADSELDKTKQELKNEQEASAASAQKAELLNNKILEMQSSRSWRYTRIFRKNKKDEEI